MLKTFALESLPIVVQRVFQMPMNHDLQLSLKYNFRLDRFFEVR